MITNKNLVFKIKDKMSKKQILTLISEKLYDDGASTSKIKVLKGFEDREKETSTGMTDGIAIPHTSIPEIKEARIVVAKLSYPINWKSLDGKMIDTVIAIVVAKSGRADHFELLTQLTGKLADPEFIKEFKKMNLKQTVDFINTFKLPKRKSIVSKKSKKIVGVTTCPVGIAHTFMSAEAIEKAAEKAGFQVKIEKQAAIGTKDELTAKEIQEADFVIIGAGKEIEGRERFVGKKGLEWTNLGMVIREADRMVKEATTNPQPINSGLHKKNPKGGAKTKSTGTTQKISASSHMMAGLSYMIPFVVTGGIFLAISMGMGYAPDETGAMVAKNQFWAGINFMGSEAFLLMIPILAGFTANSIAGRSAIAPAAILALVFNSTGGEANWNWFANGMGFGGFESSPALGFLGAIVFGYFVGYSIKIFNYHIEPPKWLAPAMPIFFIPIGFTAFWWLIFAYFGYLPLYAFALAFNILLGFLSDNHLMLFLGIIIGAMISFDMGGPINKIAFAFGVTALTTLGLPTHSANGGDQVMGMVSASIPVAPLGAALGVLIGKTLHIVDFDDEDVTNASSAGLMSLIGISEGAIPFAIKYPKVQFIANITGGAVTGALAGLLMITSVAAHGGPIVGFVGGISWNIEGASSTMLVPTILYMVIILIGGLVTAFVMISGLWLEKRIKNKNIVNDKEMEKVLKRKKA